ncbi:MAG: S-layer homology domain-containing protein [Clostridia bacterium]|nr:S-layer homology domain-containing protein [Clostridia bacterium]
MKKLISIVLSVSVLAGVCPIAAHASGFSDVTYDNKAYEAVNYLAAKGIVSGVGDNKFMPEASVKRADFAVMADNALELSDQSSTAFSDVYAEDYYYYAVQRASGEGIISGTGNGLFEPNRSITREEAASILVRAFEKRNGATASLDMASEYADKGEVSAWALEAVDKALALNLITAENGIEPKRAMTRAETAYAVANLLLLESENSVWDSGKKSYIEQTTARGNIFLVSHEKKLMTLVTGRKAIEYIIRDYWGRALEHKYIRIENEKHVFDVSDYTPGYYELYVYARDSQGLKEEISRASFCVFEDFDFKSLEYSPFGMNTHITRGASGWKPDLLHEASLMGVRHLRDSDEWGGVERSKGVYTDTWADKRAIMDKYGMDNLWVSAYVNPFYDNNSTPYTEDGRTGFANYCKGIRDIWGDKMMLMEVYNEWWGPQFGDRGSGEANSLPETFVPLVKKTYETVKPNHPDVILMPTFSTNANRYQPNWNTNLLKLGILDYIDAIALHGYAGNDKTPGKTEPEGSIAATVKELRDELDEKFPDREVDIYVTETGLNTSTNKYGISEKLGAWYVPRVFTSCMALGVKSIWWYDLIDDGNTDSEHEDRFGTLRAFGSKYGNYTPKPTYVAYGAFARTIAGQHMTAEKRVGDIYWYVYGGKGEDTHVIHARDDVKKNITVYTDSPVEVIDIMGGKSVYTPVDGKLYFTASGESIYIKGDVKDIKEECPISLTADGEVILGETYSVTVDNGGTGLDIEIEGRTAENGSFTPDILYIESDRTVIAEVKNGTMPAGRITAEVSPTARYEITANGDLEGTGDSVEGYIYALVKNLSARELPLTGLVWTLEDRSGTFAAVESIPAKSQTYVKIPVGQIETGVEYDYTVRTQIGGITSDELDISDTITFNAIKRFTPVIDGVVDAEFESITGFNLDEATVSSLIDGRKHTGASDLGGKGWMTYDDKYLYWIVDVTDDDHNIIENGMNMWRNDNLQFTLYCENSELYDEVSKYFELGISLTQEGGVQVYRWRTIDDMPEDLSIIPDAVYAASRNEDTKHTVYEIGIPWTTLKVDPTVQKNIRSSILINDNDSGQRKSFLEWGSGIGYGKDPNAFIKYIISGGEANE